MRIDVGHRGGARFAHDWAIRTNRIAKGAVIGAVLISSGTAGRILLAVALLFGWAATFALFCTPFCPIQVREKVAVKKNAL